MTKRFFRLCSGPLEGRILSPAANDYAITSGDTRARAFAWPSERRGAQQTSATQTNGNESGEGGVHLRGPSTASTRSPSRSSSANTSKLLPASIRSGTSSAPTPVFFLWGISSGDSAAA